MIKTFKHYNITSELNHRFQMDHLPAASHRAMWSAAVKHTNYANYAPFNMLQTNTAVNPPWHNLQCEAFICRSLWLFTCEQSIARYSTITCNNTLNWAKQHAAINVSVRVWMLRTVTTIDSQGQTGFRALGHHSHHPQGTNSSCVSAEDWLRWNVARTWLHSLKLNWKVFCQYMISYEFFFSCLMDTESPLCILLCVTFIWNLLKS